MNRHSGKAMFTLMLEHFKKCGNSHGVSGEFPAVRRGLVSTVIVQSMLQQRLALVDHRPRLACIDILILILIPIAISVILCTTEFYSQLGLISIESQPLKTFTLNIFERYLLHSPRSITIKNNYIMVGLFFFPAFLIG